MSRRKRPARGRKPSRGWRRWQRTLARRKRQIALEKRRQLHEAAKVLASSARVVRMENLDLRNMTASAAGTADEPGRNVAAKAGLNRALLEIPKYGFRLMVQYKVQARGGRLELVPPAHTSQRCNACGHIERANRIEQAVFHCQRCGHRDHADINAAKNIRDSRVDVAFRPEARPDLLTGLERAGGTRRPAQKPHEATKSAGRGLCDGGNCFSTPLRN